jgi:hypothetical protein
MSKYTCADCGVEVSRGAKRCRKCAGLARRGENHYNWKGKGGRHSRRRKPKPKSYCIDCGKEITPGAKRCRECYKAQWKPNPKSYCVDCGREIASHSTRCQSCAIKATWERGDHDNHSEKMRVNWESGVYDDHSEKMRAAYERGCFDGVFQSPTSIEVAVSRALDKFGLKHQSQFRPDGYSKVYDEFIHPNILIEVQGSYFHSTKEAQERDLEKAHWAHSNGYKFIAIWDFHLEEYGAESLVKWWILPLNPTKRAEYWTMETLF